jgi:adenylate cyclase
MRNREKVLGMVNISQTKKNSVFSSGDIEMLSVIVKQAIMALEKIQSIRKREETCRITALLEQYVSPEISEILAHEKDFRKDSGKVLELTVLFADIRKFTLLVQRLPPAKLRIFLNKFFELFAEIVFSCKGMIDKFMGDAALVVFGAPIEIQTPSLSAVSAAEQIMKEFESLRQSWAEKDAIFEEIGLGIGISRGPMFLGNVGSVRRLDYTVIGTDVNIAQRLASETASGQILLTESVRRDIKDKYRVNAGEKKLLRGMDSKIMVYSLNKQD